MRLNEFHERLARDIGAFDRVDTSTAFKKAENRHPSFSLGQAFPRRSASTFALAVAAEVGLVGLDFSVECRPFGSVCGDAFSELVEEERDGVDMHARKVSGDASGGASHEVLGESPWVRAARLLRRRFMVEGSFNPYLS